MTALARVVDESSMVSASTGLEPRDIGEVFRVAEIAVRSGLAPRAVKNVEAAAVMIMTGRELGLTAMQSLRSIHVVEGKPVLSSDLMAALVLRHPRCESFRCVKSTSDIATFSAVRAGQETQLSFTIGQARDAGLTGKDNWKKYPDAMLRARCIAALCRLVFPDLFLGVYETDEIPAPAPAAHEIREVRAVPESRPTPKSAPAPDSGTREADDVDARLDTIKFDLDASTDATEVAVLLGKLVEIKLPKDHPRRRELMSAYAAAQARTKPAPPPVEVEREREPGEEG